MARYTGPVCKLCRREGVKLYLKGERCYKSKCSLERKKSQPGQHGKVRRKLSDYGVQLREKQKVKRIYGVLERQFFIFYDRAHRSQGVTGDVLMSSLERRLDNVIYRAGLASSRNQARQLVNHGHFSVNGRKVDIPSFQVSSGDVVSLNERSKDVKIVKESFDSVEGRGIPTWITLDKPNFKLTVTKLPERTDVEYEISEQLIVELYSK